MHTLARIWDTLCAEQTGTTFNSQNWTCHTINIGSQTNTVDCAQYICNAVTSIAAGQPPQQVNTPDHFRCIMATTIAEDKYPVREHLIQLATTSDPHQQVLPVLPSRPSKHTNNKRKTSNQDTREKIAIPTWNKRTKQNKASQQQVTQVTPHTQQQRDIQQNAKATLSKTRVISTTKHPVTTPWKGAKEDIPLNKCTTAPSHIHKQQPIHTHKQTPEYTHNQPLHKNTKHTNQRISNTKREHTKNTQVKINAMKKRKQRQADKKETNITTTHDPQEKFFPDEEQGHKLLRIGSINIGAGGITSHLHRLIEWADEQHLAIVHIQEARLRKWNAASLRKNFKKLTDNYHHKTRLQYPAIRSVPTEELCTRNSFCYPVNTYPTGYIYCTRDIYVPGR